MDRWISARRRIRGDAAVLRDELVRHLPELLASAAGIEHPAQPDGDGSFTMPLQTTVGHSSLVKEVRVRIEPERSVDLWTRLPMTWEATSSRRAYPVFQGAVELEQLDGDYVELAIIGHYDPPLGPLGQLVDAIGMHGPAQATIDWLATALADALAEAVTHAPTTPARERHRLVVRQVMATRPLRLREEDSLREAARSLLIAGVEGAPVFDAHDRVVGVLSLKDLLDKVAPAPTGGGRKASEARRHHAAVTVGDACSRPARTTEADARLRDAAGEMVQHGVGRLVVLDGAKVVGLVDRSDVMVALIRHDDVVAHAAAEVVHALAPEVVVTVEQAVVVLKGAVDTRSKADHLSAKVRDLDGVLDVDVSRLTWLRDDLLALQAPMM